MSPAQQLIRQLGLVRRTRAVKNQPAVADDVAIALTHDRQQSGPRGLPFSAEQSGDLLDCRPTIRSYASVRWNSWVTFGPQLPADDGVLLARTPQNKPICLDLDWDERGFHRASVPRRALSPRPFVLRAWQCGRIRPELAAVTTSTSVSAIGPLTRRSGCGSSGLWVECLRVRCSSGPGCLG